jgi:hypothetical protein
MTLGGEPQFRQISIEADVRVKLSEPFLEPEWITTPIEAENEMDILIKDDTLERVRGGALRSSAMTFLNKPERK